MAFQKRTIVLIGEAQVNLAIAAIKNAPLGIEIVLREPVKVRSLDQNAAYWAALNDISEQAWIRQRQYSADIWHIFYKDHGLPDETQEPYLYEHVKNPESYHKYGEDIHGNKIVIASTTDLTKYGFSQFLEKVFAYGSELGVLFSTNKI